MNADGCFQVDPKAAGPARTGERALGKSALSSRAGAVCGVVAGDHRLYTKITDQLTVLVVVVTSSVRPSTASGRRWCLPRLPRIKGTT